MWVVHYGPIMNVLLQVLLFGAWLALVLRTQPAMPPLCMLSPGTGSYLYSDVSIKVLECTCGQGGCMSTRGVYYRRGMMMGVKDPYRRTCYCQPQITALP